MRSGFQALGRLQLQAIVLLAIVFAIGVLAGVAFERSRESRWRPPRPMPPPRGLPPELVADLALTPAQEDEIQGILDRNRPRTDAILDEFLPRLRAVTDSVRLEIRAVLDPRQQEIFDRAPPYLLGGQRPPFDRPPGGPPRGERGPDRHRRPH